jgi:hypothetical protein
VQILKGESLRLSPAQGIEAEIPQTPQPLAVLYLLLCRDPPIGVQRGWGRDRKNIWNSLPSAFCRAYRRYDVSKIAEADSTSIFPGFFPAPLYTYGMGRGIEADSPVSGPFQHDKNCVSLRKERNMALIRFDDTDDLIDICYDNVFKAVFTKDTPASQGALSKLISALIGQDISVTAISANEPPIDNLRDRQIRFDIACKAENGERINVEMSLNPDPFEPVRAIRLAG